MPPRWPENPDDPIDPAVAPLIEAGEGEAEGFDVARQDLIDHAAHGDYHSTDPILRNAIDEEEEARRLDYDELYGEADDEDPDE